MSGTLTGQDLARDLLDGTINAAALETLLADTPERYLGPYKALIRSGTLSALLAKSAAFAALYGSEVALTELLDAKAGRDAVLASSGARTALAASSAPLAKVFNTAAYRSTFLANSSMKTALESAVNNSTYLYRETVTATGNYTPHADGIAAMYVVGAGHGGKGGTASSSKGGQGGSGAELAGKWIPVASIPNSAVSCTLPTTAGAPATFGALLSVTSGTDGTTSSSNRAGGGSTTGGGAAAGLSNTNLDAAAFHIADFTQIGGYGGEGGTDAGQNGVAGEAGTTGSGGAGGTSSTAGGAGTGLCSGGGGGHGTNNSPDTPIAGAAATAPGCGGGGGETTGDGNEVGGNGGPAKFWVYTVRNKP